MGKADGCVHLVFKVCGNYFSSRAKRLILVSHLPCCPTSVNVWKSPFPVQWAAGGRGPCMRCFVSPVSTHQAERRGSECLMKQEGPAFLILMGLLWKGIGLSDFQDQEVHPSPDLGARRSLTTSLESCGEDLLHPTPLHSRIMHTQERREQPISCHSRPILPFLAGLSAVTQI